MKGFIEVHDKDGREILLNIQHIVEVRGNSTYTDDIPPFSTAYPYILCRECYEEIRDKIMEAEHERQRYHQGVGVL